jgi:aryl-alcohol dehydrogenase-like predicted oxidoreductase
MTLPTRSLGDSGLAITTVGFGAWAAGGGGWSFGWGPQDDAESLGAMRRASEEVVGRLLRDIPAASRPLVFTKCGLVWNEAERMAAPQRNLQPASVRRECEASLRRLGVERIDLYQFHWPDQTGTAIEDSWSEMGRLIDAGKVRFGGVSNMGVDLLDRCEALRHVSSVQPPLSAIQRGAADTVLPWCRRHSSGVIVYSPMQTGILTDSFSQERIDRMAADDWRRGSAEFQAPRLERNLSLRDALRAIGARHGATVESVAIAWTLAWPGVTGAIVGARSPAQVDGWIGGASLVLSAADLDEIAAAITRTAAGNGPVRPRA